MPRYFFHTYDSQSHVDREGIDLASDDEAWSQGLRFIGAWLSDRDGKMRSGETCRLECRDVEGKEVFYARFEAVKSR